MKMSTHLHTHAHTEKTDVTTKENETKQIDSPNENKPWKAQQQ